MLLALAPPSIWVEAMKEIDGQPFLLTPEARLFAGDDRSKIFGVLRKAANYDDAIPVAVLDCSQGATFNWAGVAEWFHSVGPETPPSKEAEIIDLSVFRS